jgi:hypothetical protein
MKMRSTIIISIITAILAASIPAVFAQRQPSANEIYIDKNCQRNQQLPRSPERLILDSGKQFTFTTNGQNYLFYAASNTATGEMTFCISKPNFNQPKVLNLEEIQREFADKIVRVPNNKTAFIIVVRKGNGMDVPMINYGLELSNVDRPKLTSLSILQQQGTLKEGGSGESTFPGRAGQSITIDFKSRAFDHNIALLDTSGKTIAEKTGNSQNRRESQIIVKLPSNGTYKIVVKGGDRTSKGTYTLSVNSNQL